jgi:hypothetical protein
LDRIDEDSRSDAEPNSAEYVWWIWLVGHSAPRLSPEFLGSEPKFAEPSARPQGAAQRAAAKLVSDPNNSCAECPTSQILRAVLVFEMRRLPTPVAEGDALGGAAWTWGFAK